MVPLLPAKQAVINLASEFKSQAQRLIQRTKLFNFIFVILESLKELYKEKGLDCTHLDKDVEEVFEEDVSASDVSSYGPGMKRCLVQYRS